MKPTWFDRLVTLGSPQRLLQRVAARASLEMMSRSLDNGSEAGGQGRRFAGWSAGGGGPNVQTQFNLDTLRNRHRELVRNNPWCARAKQAIVSHTVGHGISVEIKGGNADANARVNALWKAWFDTKACDASGMNDGYGLQAQILGGVVEGGELFVRARWRRPGDGLPVPLQLQLLEPEYCDHRKSQELPNGRIVQGIEFDMLGRRRTYYMFREHPFDIAPRDLTTYPVSADDVAHVYRAERPGMVHGVPWGVPIFLTVKDLDGFEDAYLLRQKLTNCFVGVMHDVDAPTIGNATASKSVLPDSMEPGAMLSLPSGKKITFNAPPPADDYGPFTQSVLMRIAQGYGITYQTLTGDLTKVNFTSGRMGRLDMNRNIDCWRWHMLVPMALERIVEWFLEAVQLQDPKIDTTGMYAECTPPRQEMLAPQIEVPAEIKAVRGMLWSLKESHRSRGVRTDEVLTEVAEVNAMLDAKEIVSDSDPRRVTQVGNAADVSTPQENPDGQSQE